ncbi:Predicted DNA binding protein, contains HTH domain [Halorubrum aquaticum]|uniref:Predicted DNA binding protein, contains HTH domain n=1 Tax=Halorubrum aquaticum TaxID=387340 RepID=A0A1I3B474_9EURY|nr:helix-turn-helix domain-containing protein [Halorubrum aquaticum]SFH57105.1 Predicted DNA binding protein, contains HTH domain [Halorubrum aquaticum]
MAIEATFTATDGEFPLAAVFSEFPAAEIELDRVVPTNEFIIPYFWVRDVEIENVSMENVTHPGIHDIRVIDDVDEAAFIRIDWDLEYESVLTAIIENDVNLISALGSEDQWSFEFRAESREALADFQSYCRDHDIPLELTKLHALSPFESGQEYDLTDTQREAMTVAFTLGYYESPREATRRDVANELGISPQAVGSRLRRGTRRLISSTLMQLER